MFSLPQLISIGLTGLSASGLSVYFVPKYLEGDDASNVVYESEILDYLAERKYSELIEGEEKLLTQLKEKYEKFKTALQGVGSTKNKVHGEVDTQLQKVAKEEQELEKLYKEIQDMVSKLQKLGEQQAKVMDKKLAVDSLVEALKYYNDAMLKTNTAMTSGGGAINQILCAIKDSKGEKDCSKEDKGLVSNDTSAGQQQGSSPTASPVKASSDTGGGTEASQQAKKQLKDSEDKLTTQLKSLKAIISKNSLQHLFRQYQELAYKKVQEHLKTQTEFLSAVSKKQGEEINTKVESGKEKTETLNSSYQKLQDTHNKGEKLKRSESTLQNGAGQLQSFICNISSYQNRELCTLNIPKVVR